MKKSAAPKNARKPRADAQRNRELILEVAKQVFTRRGAEDLLRNFEDELTVNYPPNFPPLRLFERG